ncbi:MAG: dihydroneopterin aldolase [Acidimicrobiales bacterium]
MARGPASAQPLARADGHLELSGLRLLGRHGVLEEERRRDQPFEIDLDVEMDMEHAAASDRLSDALDYAGLLPVVAQAFGRPAALLEHLAARLADAVMASAPAASAVTVSVRKLRPPVPFDLASAGVRLRRERRAP